MKNEEDEASFVYIFIAEDEIAVHTYVLLLLTYYIYTVFPRYFCGKIWRNSPACMIDTRRVCSMSCPISGLHVVGIFMRWKMHTLYNLHIYFIAHKCSKILYLFKVQSPWDCFTDARQIQLLSAVPQMWQVVWPHQSPETAHQRRSWLRQSWVPLRWMCGNIRQIQERPSRPAHSGQAQGIEGTQGEEEELWSPQG